ncbi:trypsin-like peptidase domain-containing protein [Phormidium tenue FACHB-886]|nr:trypsin-like peptidase domain-containing protein [Phormidium tenue FACHB-886]
MSRLSVPRPILYLALLFMGAAGLTLARQLPPEAPLQRLQPTAGSSAADSSDVADAANPNFITAAVEKASPAVVRINSTRESANSSTRSQGRVVRGTGSGFILNSEGYILTNAHVVNGADSVTVILNDGRSFTGQVLGEDRSADVAVVQIPARNLPAVAIGNSADLRPGDWAIAIGNPLGLDHTVTVGIISGIDRAGSDIGARSSRDRFIQTDAAINPGNSGGPLLNQQGQVVGINTAIIGDAQGLGFAIPIDRAQAIADRLISSASPRVLGEIGNSDTKTLAGFAIVGTGIGAIALTAKRAGYFGNHAVQQSERLAPAQQANSRLQKKLLRLLHNDRNAADRLLTRTKIMHPDRSADWVVEKVIYDLERDRRSY